MEASPNWIRSDKLIIYSDFEGDIKISSKRASVNPLAGFLKPLSPASATATASASSTNSSSSAQAEFTGGSRTQKWIPDRALPKCPRTQKLFPRPPHELKSKNKLIFWKVWSRSDREPTVFVCWRESKLQYSLPMPRCEIEACESGKIKWAGNIYVHSCEHAYTHKCTHTKIHKL